MRSIFHLLKFSVIISYYLLHTLPICMLPLYQNELLEINLFFCRKLSNFTNFCFKFLISRFVPLRPPVLGKIEEQIWRILQYLPEGRFYASLDLEIIGPK